MSSNLTAVIIAEFKRAVAEKKVECLARRDRVLAYVDLDRKLTLPPLDYSRATQWNGYVPPTMCGEALNTSPRRHALVEISAEALRREREEQEHGGDQAHG